MSAAQDRFKRAEQAARKGNLEYAIELYLQGLSIDPNAADARRILHNIEARKIEQEGGNPAGGMGVKFKTMPIQANVKKLQMQKKWDEAALELEKALRLQPRNASLLFHLAGVLEKVPAPDAVISTLEEVVEADKGFVEAYRKLGHLWGERDDPEKAISYFEKLRMYRPEDKEANKAIRDLSAASMVKRAEERKAATGDESYKALLKDEEESAELEKKGKVIRTDEDRRQAIKFKMEEIKKDPRNSRLWRELGMLYRDLKDFKHARAAYEKALEVNPHDLFAKDKIGELKEQQAESKVEALRAEIEAASRNGRSAEEIQALEERLVVVEKEVLRFKIEEYERRVKAHPPDYELKVRYGKLLLEGEHYDTAIEQFQKAVKDPKYKVQSLNLMGQCFQRKGVYALAVKQYADALKGVSDPDSELAKDVKYNLAVASEESGNSADALKYYQEIMAVDIGYKDVSERVNRLMSSEVGG